MQIGGFALDYPSFIAGAVSMGVMALGIMLFSMALDAFVTWRASRTPKVKSYGRHSMRGWKQANRETPCDDPEPTVVMQTSKPSLEATRQRSS